jgi:hypothetical protein
MCLSPASGSGKKKKSVEDSNIPKLATALLIAYIKMKTNPSFLSDVVNATTATAPTSDDNNVNNIKNIDDIINKIKQLNVSLAVSSKIKCMNRYYLGFWYDRLKEVWDARDKELYVESKFSDYLISKQIVSSRSTVASCIYYYYLCEKVHAIVPDIMFYVDMSFSALNLTSRKQVDDYQVEIDEFIEEKTAFDMQLKRKK